MRGFIVSTVVTAIALAVVIYVLPQTSISGPNRYLAIFIVAAVFGVVNALIRPIVKLLALPLTVVTLGLSGVIINGLLVLLTAAIASNFGVTFKVDTYPPDLSLAAVGTAILVAIIISVVRSVIDLVLPG